LTTRFVQRIGETEAAGAQRLTESAAVVSQSLAQSAAALTPVAEQVATELLPEVRALTEQVALLAASQGHGELETATFSELERIAGSIDELRGLLRLTGS